MATVLIWLFGIILPALTLAIELISSWCAEVLFDPIPTLAHVLLVALVPTSNLISLLVWGNANRRWRTLALWLNGAALGVSLFYALVFLPFTLHATIGIIFFGIGLLPLAALFSFFCAIALRRRLGRMTDSSSEEVSTSPTPQKRSTLVSLFVGGALGFGLLLALEARTALTLMGAEMAANGSSPHQQQAGLRLLRSIGDRDELLSLCYRDEVRWVTPFSRGQSPLLSGYLFDGLPREEAQKVFFRVTGEPYNAFPPPNRKVRQMMFDDFDFDPDLGGERVAGRRKGLLLAGSRIDAKIYPDPAVAYVEWTMVFKNDHYDQREARAQVLLPPGGVVSRVTLWVSGEPREAAFAGTAQVREAYQKVAVRQNRDPLLVTWAGNDRVLVQCYPVPAHGEMKIRIGITAPLHLASLERGALRLPCFAARNFGLAKRDVHSLWIESVRECVDSPTTLQPEKTDDGKHVLRGLVGDEVLSSPVYSVLVPRSADATECWTKDKLDPKKYILQKIVEAPRIGRERIVVVVDGSGDVAEFFPEIEESLDIIKTLDNPKFPLDGGFEDVIALNKEADDHKFHIYDGRALEIRVLVAGDEVTDLSHTLGYNGSKGLAARLGEIAGVGGCDNMPALLKAYDEAGDKKTIVWIHGRQPIEFRATTPLEQWIERGANVEIHDLAVCSGQNRLVEKLSTLGCLKTVPRSGSLRDDLRGLLFRLYDLSATYRFERTLVSGDPPADPESTSHIARLWAAEKISALARTGKAAKRSEAIKLAAAYQLVTPVSGAVVLENKQQYEDSDLEPADPETVPDLPEPATWIMLLALLPWLLWRVWKHRRKS